ncbi:MAG: DUF882 domain-containing protein [Bdellovibrionales bacterium]
MKKIGVLLLICVLCACGSIRGRTPSVYVLSGRGMEKTQPDHDTKRRIVLVYPYTNEKIDVVYFYKGRYDPAAMKKINTLMRDRHLNAVGKIDPELIDYMVDMRKRLSLPEAVPFQILSGYRSPKTNAKLARKNSNVAKESLHMHGWAVDFRITGVNSKAICEIAKTMQRGGVAYYPEDNHLHVDLGNIRTWHEKGARR